MSTTGAGNKMFSPHHQEGSQSFLEDAEPRPPPRIPRFPMPFDMEKLKMVVPDVSLIFNSSSGPNSFVNSTSVTVPAANGADDKQGNVGVTEKSQIKQDKDFLNSLTPEELQQEIRSLVPLVTSQGELIVRMEEKLDKILDFQEKFLSQLFQKGSAISKEVQTESFTSFTPPNQLKKKSPEAMFSSNPRTTSSPSIPPPAKLMENNRAFQIPQKPVFHQKGPMARIKYAEKNDDDLSAILKDLQLPNMDEPSVFSEASGIRSLELQEFNDESFQSGSGIDSPSLGASASTFGSSPSSDDEYEGVKPTATFYNNVLGNVNRLLEGGGTNKSGKGRENRTPSSSKSLAPYGQRQDRRTAGLSSGNSSSSSNRENVQSPVHNDNEPGNEVVEATKRYLEKLGVQFGSPSPAEKRVNAGNSNKNYMIQQNVYNSIYIPTVNCPPVMPDTSESNGESSNFNTLAQKYVASHELQQFDALKAHNEAKSGGTTETTVYGMSPNNLSFATKQYLQRYGLVHEQTNQGTARKQLGPAQPTKFSDKTHPRNEKILDITAIKNQPKLL